MNLSENIDTFLADLGVQVTWGAVSALGIFEMPDQIVGQFGISAEYSIVVNASVFAAAAHGDTINVEGSDYKVKEFRRMDDGALARISLSKV